MSIVSKVDTYCDICGMNETTPERDTDRIGWLETREYADALNAVKKIALPPPKWKPARLTFVRDFGGYCGDYCPECALKILTHIRNLKISFQAALARGETRK